MWSEGGSRVADPGLIVKVVGGTSVINRSDLLDGFYELKKKDLVFIFWA